MKKFRKEEGLSQESLAERCGVAANYIGQIEIGRRFPSIEVVERIAEALRTEPYMLFKHESGDNQDETQEFLAGVSKRFKKRFKNDLLQSISADIDRVLNIQDE